MTAAASLSLAQLQATFHQALHYQASGEQCNITSDHFSADERIQIYRNNFIISLSDVLQATYPMLLALWGEECFAQVARQHVINAPLNRADVSHYGQGFAETIMQFPAVLDAAPYSLEVAQFEWTMDLAQQQHHQTAADASWLPLSDLTQLSAEQYGLVRLKIAPGVLAFESCYALFSLQHAIQTSDFSALTLEQTEQGDFQYLLVGHRIAAARGAGAVDHQIGAGELVGAVIAVRIAGIDGKKVPRIRIEQAFGERIEPFRRLPVALLLLRA